MTLRSLRVLLVAAAVLAVGPAGAQTPTCNLNGSGADALVFTLPAAVASDFDLGWTGDYHDFHVPTGARFEACLTNCDTSTDPVCDVAGYAGGQSAVGRAFTPPIPIFIGSTAACAVTTFQEPFATGTANVQTGDINVVANISGDVYITTAATVCPVCSGANAGDSGTCSATAATPGGACTTDEVITVSGATGNPYRVSRDCLPTGAHASTAFSLTVTTGASTVNATCAGQLMPDNCSASCGSANCTGAGNGSGVSQNCCTDDTTQRCFPYPLTRTGTAAVPSPAWPDTTYPKTANETLGSAFCVPAVPGLPGLAVNGPVGLAGPAAFVLPGSTQWLLDSTPTSSSTTSTTSLGSTTTTTQPVACTTAAECDDADPCTDDTCPAGTCVNAPAAGAQGVICGLDDLTTEPACEPLDPTLKTTLDTLIAKAKTKLGALGSASPGKAKKLRKAADKSLKKALKKINKAANKGTIQPPCKDALTAAIGVLRAAIAALA